ncbi:hypothetical protein D3C76_1373820 [compost metagenome]
MPTAWTVAAFTRVVLPLTARVWTPAWLPTPAVGKVSSVMGSPADSASSLLTRMLTPAPTLTLVAPLPVALVQMPLPPSSVI